jgi:hypothetical protein
MSDILSIIKPFAATNYVLNPSFEKWTAGVPDNWTAYGTPTLAQDSSGFSWRGVYSCSISAASGNRGIYQDITLTNGQSYRISVYAYLATGNGIIVTAEDKGGGNPVATTSSLVGWQRLSVTKVAAANGIRISFGSNNTAVWALFDCAQVEDGAETTTYIDGYQPGCYWNGTPHASTSTRSDQTREGGRIIPLNTVTSRILSINGAGMPGFTNVSMPFGLIGGEIYQRTVKQVRTFMVEVLIEGTSRDDLHSKRRVLEDLLKFDLVTPVQPVKLLYNDGISATTLTIHAVYDAGLEGAPFGGGGNALWEKVMLRFIAHDPLWYDDRQACQVLGYNQTVTNANYILQRKSGVWSALNYGTNGSVYALIFAPSGLLYVCGAFSKCGNAAAADLTVNGIASWNGATWAVLGATGVSGGGAVVYCMTIGPDGALYIGGNFSLAGGVANTLNIAKWDGSVFTPLGTGCNGAVESLLFSSDGNLYAGGAFHLAGGVANTVHVAKWNGTVWLPLGTGMDDDVHCIAQGNGTTIYIGGEFLNANGVACTRIAKWNGTTFIPLGSGFDAFPIALTLGPDKKLYAGGTFHNAGGIACNHIAAWNGITFLPLSTGLNNEVSSLAFNQNQTLYIGGNFTIAGDVTVPDGVAIFTGSAWLPLDVDLPGTPTTIDSLCFDNRSNLYVGYIDTGSATSATVTATVNASTKTYPSIWMVGPGTIYQIINYTTGRAIYFNALTIQAGEQCALYLKPGNVHFVSSWRGDINNYILQGSNMDWYLQPGSNNVSAYLVGGTAASLVYMNWNDAKWSNDGVA